MQGPGLILDPWMHGGTVVKIRALMTECRLGAGTMVTLPLTLSASWGWEGILGQGWGVQEDQGIPSAS